MKIIKLDKTLAGYDCPFKFDFWLNDRDKTECCSVLDGNDCIGTDNGEKCPLKKHKTITVKL